jgi:hypothetical protein
MAEKGKLTKNLEEACKWALQIGFYGEHLGPITRDFLDHTGSPGLGANFNEGGNSFFEHALNNGREIEAVKSIQSDGFGGRFGGHFQGSPVSNAINRDIRIRINSEDMEIVVGITGNFRDGTMDRGNSGEGNKASPQFSGNGFNGGAPSANDAFGRGIDDKKVGAGVVGESFSDGFNRPGDQSG